MPPPTRFPTTCAPLGAEKLYQALKFKTVKKTRVTDLNDLP
jgi:hypothetical protein